MGLVTKATIENHLRRINWKLRRDVKDSQRRIEADYCSTYGGWFVYFFKTDGTRTAPVGYSRISHKEAYRFLEGVELMLNQAHKDYTAADADQMNKTLAKATLQD